MKFKLSRLRTLSLLKFMSLLELVDKQRAVVPNYEDNLVYLFFVVILYSVNKVLCGPVI